MSKHVSKIQNSMMDQGGIDFDFIASTLKEAPEDLRRFCEALEDMLEDHTGKRQSFRHGFMLSDRLNEIKIKELESELSQYLHTNQKQAEWIGNLKAKLAETEKDLEAKNITLLKSLKDISLALEALGFYAKTSGWDNGKQTGKNSYEVAREALKKISEGNNGKTN